jgi:hypothetical protein
MTRHPSALAAGAVSLLAAAVLVLACGKKGDPEPPIRLIPSPTTELTVVQRGGELLLDFPYPQTTAAGTPLPGLSEIAVWLLVWRAPETAPDGAQPKLEVDERVFLAEARPVRVVTGDELPEVVRGDRIVVSLPVPGPPEEGAGRAVTTVAVKTQGPNGEESTLSNRVSFPSIEPPAPPTGLEVRDLATGVRVRWDYPRAEGEEAEPGESEGEDEDEEAAEAAETAAGEEETAAEEELEPEEVPEAEAELEAKAELEGKVEPEAETEVEAGEEQATDAAEEEPGAEAAGTPAEPGLAGFNVYRRQATERTYGAPLRTVGARSRVFLDESALFGERYIYAVSAVASRRPVVVESRLAEEVEVDYRDRFAPPVPQGLVALSEEGRVRLVWQESAVPDLAGYRIYRRGPDGEEFRPLPGELVTATEHADRDLAPGATYRYRVTAVDRLGNESRPSETVTAVIR